jgi:hypothetical protein
MEPDDSNRTWAQRHALTLIIVVLVTMFALVIVVQKVT